MSGATIDPRVAGRRTAPRKKLTLSWSDPRLRAIVWQVLIVGLLVGIIGYMVNNTMTNLQNRRIATGWAFMSRSAGIPIGEHLIDYDPAISTFGRALLVGVLNTLKVAIIGVVLATVLGTLIGIARLSRNWLLARLSAVYVEVVRDIPVLLQLLFWYTVMQTLPAPRASFNPLPGVFISNRGIKVPLLEWEPAHWWTLAAVVLGWMGTIAWSRAADRKQEATGIRPKVWPGALAMMVAMPLLVWAALGAPFTLEMPVLRGFNFQGGGLASPEYGALLVGLVLYTSAYIAEIVRSGILAVPTGQWEAAGALGLRPGVVLRKIVLPQSLRVIIPPMTSQYLNLTKNSSLAVAIGYQDVVSIANTTLNQTGQAVEGIAFIMGVYLCISLSISLFMNWYNARIALVER
jgi:general L-amino acid transport system permease protein